MSKKPCSKCGRRYKGPHRKKELSMRLCKLMGWDHPWRVQNTALAQDQMEQLCEEIETSRIKK